MLDEIQSVLNEAEDQILKARSHGDLEAISSAFMGKKGKLTLFLRNVGDLSAAKRPLAGKAVNEAKAGILQLIEQRARALDQIADQAAAAKSGIDVTLPGRRIPIGKRHPVQIVLGRIIEIFTRMGYEVVDGPELESDWYNFEALNIPEAHPARDEQDSFFLGDGYLLRTHTSPMQIRTMEGRKPPVMAICPGKCYRRDVVSSRHAAVFTQVEGFHVDKNITFSDLKGVLTAFARELFGQKLKMRFRPSFFPFTEPSAEVDISCFICGGDGCIVCKRSGWLEILGSGMIHPQVLKNVGYDPEEAQGFAFGMGVERIALLEYGINDIRLFCENDMRFLRQF